MTQRLSTLRSQLTQVKQQLPELLQDCFGREPLLPGSLYVLRRKCGKPNCRCTRGQLLDFVDALEAARVQLGDQVERAIIKHGWPSCPRIKLTPLDLNRSNSGLRAFCATST